MDMMTTLQDNMRYGSDPVKDKKVVSQKVTDRVKIAKSGYGLDWLVDDPSPLVRFEVALHGYGLQFLENDPDADVRRAVMVVRRPKPRIIYCGLELTLDRMYGFDSEKDKLVDSPKVADRVSAAKMCYGLDKLVLDPSPLVRYYVAKHDYALQQLRNDPSARVRKLVERRLKL